MTTIKIGLKFLFQQPKESAKPTRIPKFFSKPKVRSRIDVPHNTTLKPIEVDHSEDTAMDVKPIVIDDVTKVQTVLNIVKSVENKDNINMYKPTEVHTQKSDTETGHDHVLIKDNVVTYYPSETVQTKDMPLLDSNEISNSEDGPKKENKLIIIDEIKRQYSSETQQSEYIPTFYSKEEQIVNTKPEIIAVYEKGDLPIDKNEKEMKRHRLRKFKSETSIENLSRERRKSIVEIEILTDTIKGKVVRMIERMNSIDKVNLQRDDSKITKRDMPKRQTVLDKIALFEVCTLILL